MIKPNKLINNMPYYDIEQLAFILNKSKRTVQRIAARKGIEYLRLGRAPYFSPDAVDKFIAKLTVKAKIFINKEVTR